MHGELALLVGATAGVVSGAVALVLRRPKAVTKRLATVARRFVE